MIDYLGPYLLGPNDENQGIYTGDALNLLTQVPEQSVDAIIIDPPYCAGAISESQRTRARGQGLRSNTISRFGWFVGDNMGTAGLTWLLRNIALESVRIIKDTGSLLTFCDWRMISALQPAIESAGLRFQSMIIWDKGSMGLGFGFRHQHETILHFTFGAPEYHDLGTGDILQVKRVSQNEREHQTEKPVELLMQLISVVVPLGGIVIDSFVGGGTTAIAAKILGRRWLAFEIDPDTADKARGRVRMTQAPLFVMQEEQLGMELP